MWVEFSLPSTLIWQARIRKAFSHHFYTNIYCTFIFKVSKWKTAEPKAHGIFIEWYIYKHCMHEQIHCLSWSRVIQYESTSNFKEIHCGLLAWPACTSAASRGGRAQAQVELRLCRRGRCSSASVSETHLHNVAEQTLQRPSRSLVGFFFLAAPLVFHLSVGGDWPVQVANCSLPLIFAPQRTCRPWRASLLWARAKPGACTGFLARALRVFRNMTQPRENSSSVGLFCCGFSALTRRWESSPQDVEHRDRSPPRQWSCRVMLGAVCRSHDDQYHSGGHTHADFAGFHLCFVDIHSVKQQPVLCGNIQLCFQCFTAANLTLNHFMSTAHQMFNRERNNNLSWWPLSALLMYIKSVAVNLRQSEPAPVYWPDFLLFLKQLRSLQ